MIDKQRNRVSSHSKKDELLKSSRGRRINIIIANNEDDVLATDFASPFFVIFYVFLEYLTISTTQQWLKELKTIRQIGYR